MKTLQQLIKAKKFDWVNPKIENNFTAVEVSNDTEYKLFHFDTFISSEDAIREIEKEGYRPANISELLSWEDWNEKDWVISLGSVVGVRGGRIVPVLDEDGSGRYFFLCWFAGGWDADCRFLACKSDSAIPSDTLSLENRIKAIEDTLSYHNLGRDLSAPHNK